MGFAEAVRTVLTKYVVFSGRARRSEYWWFALFTAGLNLALSGIDRAMGNAVLGTLVSLALVLPSIAVFVRRMHDTGRSGWWWLIALIPIIGWIVLIVFECQDSQPGTNRFGASPKRVLDDPSWPDASGPYGSGPSGSGGYGTNPYGSGPYGG